jgi:hypothetical protein
MRGSVAFNHHPKVVGFVVGSSSIETILPVI